MARLTEFHHQQSIGRMPGDRNLLNLDASLAIPTRVLHFEVSGLRRHTPVRLVLLTVRPVWSCCCSVFGSSVLDLWINQEPSGFLVNHRKPRELGADSADRHS
jgi:hypothetical protein